MTLLPNKKKIKKILPGIIFPLISISVAVHAQELSNIGKSPLLTMNGGVSLNQVYFHSNDSLAGRDPYAYTLMANLNTSVYGWAIPVSIIYSNRQWSYHQPFNQFSLSPSYKWVKLHIGYSSMSFSPYTLNGYQFLGGGVELTPPGKFRISVMGGRLQKRILPDSTAEADPAYARFGTGLKAEYNMGFGNIGAIVFYARDNANSLPPPGDTNTVVPQENLALGFTGNFTILQKITVNIEYSKSTFSDNILSPESDKQYSFLPIYKRRISTHQYNAVKTGLNYNSIIGSFGLGFERVDPGYRTLGAYYNNNDFVNYTVNYAGGLFKNKISMALSYGLQQDNLSGNKGQENKRTVANVNLGFNPVEKLNFALFYSNFNNYTHIRNTFKDINSTSPYKNLDTLDFTQISENIGGSANYAFGEAGKLSHNLNLTVNYQQASQQQYDVPSNAGSQFYIVSGGYNLKIAPANLTPGIMINYSENRMDTLSNEILGPSVSLRKSFLDRKMNLSCMVSYNKSTVNKAFQGENTLLRLSAGYVLAKKHNFNLGCVTAWRHSETMGKRNETTVTLTYSYNFSFTPGKKGETDKPVTQP